MEMWKLIMGHWQLWLSSAKSIQISSYPPPKKNFNCKVHVGIYLSLLLSNTPKKVSFTAGVAWNVILRKKLILRCSGSIFIYGKTLSCGFTVVLQKFTKKSSARIHNTCRERKTCHGRVSNFNSNHIFDSRRVPAALITSRARFRHRCCLKCRVHFAAAQTDESDFLICLFSVCLHALSSLGRCG